MCEAFQYTAAARADQVALRTIADGRTMTFAQYAEKTRRLAGGFHSLGVRRGDTVAFMLTNRPEFHPLDAAAMHLGAAPFSVYNTNSPEQIAYLLARRQAAGVRRRGSLLRRAPARRSRPTGWRSSTSCCSMGPTPSTVRSIPTTSSRRART